MVSIFGISACVIVYLPDYWFLTAIALSVGAATVGYWFRGWMDE